MKEMLTERGLKYGLTAPVLALALLFVSVLFFGVSTKDDVCSAYSDVASDLAYAFLETDMFRDANIDALASEAKNYTADRAVQQDGEDLDAAHGETYTLSGIASATWNIAALCGYYISTD